MSTSNPLSPRGAVVVEKQKRRANSCLPCRESKSRCTGGIPCTTCMKKRIKPRCIYRIVESKEAEADELRENSSSDQEETDLATTSSQQDTKFKEDPENTDDDTIVVPQESFFGPFSLARTVDEYKQKSSIDSPLNGILDLIQTTKTFFADSSDGRGVVSSQSSGGQSFLVADSHKPLLPIDLEGQIPKHIQRLHYKCLAVYQLLDTGKVTQAWTTFPSLVRDAELSGLGPDLSLDGDTLSSEVVEAHRRVWWLLVDLDIRLSVLLGRRPYLPLNSLKISEPFFSGLRADRKHLQKSRLDFTQYKMEVLMFIYPDKSAANNAMTERKSKQESLWKKFERFQVEAPAASQDGSKDIVHSIAVAKHQLDIHLFSIIFNHYLARTTTMEQSQPSGREKQSTAQAKLGKPRSLRKQSPSKYHKEMHQSARQVMELFNYIQTSDASKSELLWTQYFGTYCAALILGIARLRQESELETDSSRIEHILKVFRDVTDNKPDLPIARLAIPSLEGMVAALESVESTQRAVDQPDLEQMMHAPSIPSRNEGAAASARPRIKRDVAPINTNLRKQSKRANTSALEDDPHTDKRARHSASTPMFETQGQSAPWTPSQEQQYVQHVSSFGDMSMGSFHEQQSFPPSAATSFTGNEQMEYSGLEYTPTQDNTHHYSSWYHPPMQIHPPMYDSHWQSQGTSFAILGGNSGQHTFYGEPTAMSMNDPHHLDQQLHNQQSIMMNNMGHGHPVHSDEGSLKDTATVPVSASNALTPEHHQSHQEASFYNTRGEPFAQAEHSASSPILGNGLTQQEGLFAHPAAGSRRRSTADIRQQQRHNWTVDTPANFNDPRYRVKGKSGTDKARTPPQNSMLSPLSAPQSRRNSATPMQLSQHGMPMNLPHHTDFLLDSSIHPPMMLPLQMPPPGEEYPGSRRQSLAHATDVAMGEVMINVPSQTTPISEVASDAHLSRHGWQGAPGPPPNQPHYDPTGATSYDLAEMTNNAMTYNAQFHPPHHHHPHHDFAATARQVVTTAPFPSDTGWWRSG